MSLPPVHSPFATRGEAAEKCQDGLDTEGLNRKDKNREGGVTSGKGLDCCAAQACSPSFQGGVLREKWEGYGGSQSWLALALGASAKASINVCVNVYES